MNKTRNIIYPKCYKTFTQWCETDIYRKNIYNFIGKPKPFDVSLRDGLQSLPKDISQSFDFSKKVELYNFIRKTYMPKNIEMGSIVSEKVLPIFADSIELYKLCQQNHNGIVEGNRINKNNRYFSVINNWLLIPNEVYYEKTLFNAICPNMSFITSVSESFQQKNTKMTINQSISNIVNILQRIDDCDYYCNPLTKIYVSCINECPIEGKIPLDKIVKYISFLSTLKTDTICLSDTCGTLTAYDFTSLVRKLILNNIPLSKISLHLHVRDEQVTEDIILTALNYGITNFDVSMLSTGGCSVTMDRSKIASNLSYDLYYKSLAKWILTRTEM